MQSFFGDSVYTFRRKSKISTLTQRLHSKNVFMITGSPGCGKTIFARQIGETLFEKNIHYRITDSDKTPAAFCRHFYEELKKALPRFVSA